MSGCTIGFVFGVVLRMPCRGRFMWPLAVAGLGFKYFRMSVSDILGHPLRKPFRVALSSLDIAGLHSDWCANLTLFARVDIEWANVATCLSSFLRVVSAGRGCAVRSALMGIVHRSVIGSFNPRSIVLLL